MSFFINENGGSREFDNAVEKVRANLRDGGPPVDFVGIYRYIGGTLSESERQLIARLIYSWKNWFAAYWEAQAELDCSIDDVAIAEAPHEFSAVLATNPAAVFLSKVREDKNLSVEALIAKVREARPGASLDVATVERIEQGLLPIDPIVATQLAAGLDIALPLLLQQTAMPGPVFLGTSAALEHFQPDAGTAAIDAADLEQELGDFLPVNIARNLIDAWQKRTLKKWIEEYCKEADDFEDTIMWSLSFLSLLKDHGSAAKHLERLVRLAGEDKNRLRDALYLRGRGQWYLEKIGEAAADFQAARLLSIETGNLIREAQSLYYLARVAIVQPGRVSDSPEELLQASERLASRAGRLDFELLVKRARMIAYRSRRQRDAAVVLGREILLSSSRWSDPGLKHILDSVRSDLGVSLRGLYTEEARLEAERIYEEGIFRGRDDSHAGMCRYLMADLYIDRMLLERQHAAEERQDPLRVKAALRKSEEYRSKALALCEEAHRVLLPTGDSNALGKASRRLVLLQSFDLEPPGSDTEVASSYAVRLHRMTELFLGAPGEWTAGPYNPGVNVLTTKELEDLVNEYFAGIVRVPGSERRKIELAECLPDKCLLCIPWPVGRSLVVRVFSVDALAEKAANIGWFALRDFQNDIVPALRQMMTCLEDGMLYELRSEYFRSIQTRVSTVDPMTRREAKQAIEYKCAAVLAPQDNLHWLCPVEWLKTGPDNKEEGVALLDFTQEPVIYWTGRSVTKALAIRLVLDHVVLAATTQSATSAESIYDIVKRKIDFDVAQWDLTAPWPEMGSSKVIMLIGHESEEFGKALLTIDLRETDCVIVAACSSGHFSLQSGPFVDGIAFQLLHRLGPTGMVVCSRLPVTLDEAILFAADLLRNSNEGRPIAEIVTSHLNMVRMVSKGRVGPFECPWVTLT